MVEAKEEIKQGAQPQDKPRTEVDEDVSMMIDALEKNYNTEKINERLEALRKFKEEVSVFSLKFAKFESEHQPRLKNLPVFGKGLKFYNEINVQLIQELESEMKRTEKAIEGI